MLEDASAGLALSDDVPPLFEDAALDELSDLPFELPAALPLSDEPFFG